MRIGISGTGLFTPPFSISNEELVRTFNAWVDTENAKLVELGDAGKDKKPLEKSSAEFITSASGIGHRYAMDRTGILDPNVMRPNIAERPNDTHSIQCEMSLAAAKEAMAQAGIEPGDLGAVIVACSNQQRAYPAISVEVQDVLGVKGFAFDMNVACSSATFGINVAHDLVKAGSVQRALVVSPEICTGHLNFRDRESHFIFGDACTAVVIEDLDRSAVNEGWEIVGTRLATKFSNNIRNNNGFLSRCAPEHRDDPDKLFVQRGRAVFKEVSPMVADLIASHLDSVGVAPTAIRRMWLHQANGTMNQWIARKILGRDATEKESPSVLEEYANTSSCGSIITFHKNRAGLEAGDIGVICSFGAGYSVGSVIVKKGAGARAAA